MLVRGRAAKRSARTRMWRSRAWLVMVLVGVGLIAPAQAQAFFDGTYTGQILALTSGHAPLGGSVRLVVDHAAGVRQFTITVPYVCTDRSHFRLTQSGFPAMGIRANQFLSRFAYRKGAIKYGIGGKFVGRTVVGAFSGRLRYDRTGKLNSHGSVLCKGAVGFSAQLPAPPSAPPSGSTQPSGGTPPPTNPGTDWVSVLVQRKGFWVQGFNDPFGSFYLWHFNNNPDSNSLRTGGRSFCIYGECGLTPLEGSPFAWLVKNNQLGASFSNGGGTFVYQLVSYNSATDTLTLSYNGSPTYLYGCGNSNFPPVLRLAAC